MKKQMAEPTFFDVKQCHVNLFFCRWPRLLPKNVNLTRSVPVAQMASASPCRQGQQWQVRFLSAIFNQKSGYFRIVFINFTIPFKEEESRNSSILNFSFFATKPLIAVQICEVNVILLRCA